MSDRYPVSEVNMPLSQYLMNAIKGLEFNLVAFGDGEWGEDVKKRLIEESIGLLDEILLDPVFTGTLEFAYAAHFDKSFEVYVPGSSQLLGFLEKEKVLLAMAGLPEQPAERLLKETRRVVEDGLKGLVKPSEAFQSVVKLKFALVKAQEAPPAKGWAKIARSLALSFGGASLVGLNASGLALTMGISGPVSAVSAAAGGAILAEGAKDVVALIPG